MAENSGEKEKRPQWVKAWINSLWEFTNQHFVSFEDGSVDFEALGKEEFAFRKALFFRNFKNNERAREAYEEAKLNYDKHVEAGKKSAGRPPVYFGNEGGFKRARKPSSKEEFYDFVRGQGLPEGISRDWFEMQSKQNWIDLDGKVIRNWKGALCNYVKSRDEPSKDKGNKK